MSNLTPVLWFPPLPNIIRRPTLKHAVTVVLRFTAPRIATFTLQRSKENFKREVFSFVMIGCPHIMSSTSVLRSTSSKSALESISRLSVINQSSPAQYKPTLILSICLFPHGSERKFTLISWAVWVFFRTMSCHRSAHPIRPSRRVTVARKRTRN